MAFRISATTSGGVSAVASLTVTLPAYTVTDDIIAVVETYTNVAIDLHANALAAGWEMIFNDRNVTGGNRLAIARRKQAVSGLSNPQFVFTGGTALCAGWAASYSNRGTGAAIIGTIATNSVISVAAAATAITPELGSDVLYIMASRDDRTATPPTGMAERVDFNNTAGGATTVYLADLLDQPASTTGTKTATLSSNNYWIAVLISLPAGFVGWGVPI